MAEQQDEKPKIGVFICQCGINIGGVVKVPEVTKYAKTLPNVAYAEDNIYTCSAEGIDKIKAATPGKVKVIGTSLKIASIMTP